MVLFAVFYVRARSRTRPSRPAAITTKPKSLDSARMTNLNADKSVQGVFHNKAKTGPVYNVVRVTKQIGLQP